MSEHTLSDKQLQALAKARRIRKRRIKQRKKLGIKLTPKKTVFFVRRTNKSSD